MTLSRRELAMLFPALATAQSTAPRKARTLPSKAFRYQDLPVRTHGENRSRAVLNGLTDSGLPIELHLTELGPGQQPHPPHKHVHQELLLLQSGLLDATIDGQTTRLTAGSVAYLASNVEHGWRNPGPGRAQYFVLALGRDSG